MTDRERLANVEQMEDDVEEWRVIGGFDNYSVSNIGRVRNDRTGRILKAGLGSNGYLGVCLFNGGVKSSKSVHKLVATGFLGDSNGLEVNHIDRNKLNNNIGNLEYTTSSANHQNKTAYKGHRVQYFDQLPIGAEPLTEYHGRFVADGFYQHDREFFFKVGRQYRLLTQSRIGANSWRVRVCDPNGEEITICWTP
jgi:hypothetical protein